MSDFSLTVPAVMRRFSGDQLEDLRLMLTRRDENIVLAPIQDKEQLSLNYEGSTIAAGLRYSSMVFRHICGVLCRGLTNAVYDLSGARRRANFLDDEYSPDEAVRLFNQAVSLRFRLLMDKVLICDYSTMEVVGIAAPSYQRVSGLDVLDMSLDSLLSTSPAYAFKSAEVLGRVMLIRCQSDLEPIQVSLRDRQEQLQHGIYLMTADDGRDVLKCGQYFSRPDQTGSSWPFPHRQLPQRNPELRIALLSRITRMGGAEVEEARIRNWMELACRTNLGMGLDPLVQDRRATAIEGVVSRKCKVGQALATAMVQEALYRGADEGHAAIEDEPRLRVWPGRTVYDLYCSVARTAAARSPHSRLVMERNAHLILNGRVNV